MGFIRRAFEFVARPSHSRTLGLVLMLVLVAAVSLTVYVAQQQQETRQRAASIECGGVDCDPGQYCKSSGSDEFCADLPPTPTPNCGTATCQTGQVCLRNQIGEAGPGTRIDICVSPTPTPICGLLGGPCCSTTPECRQSGTFCSENFKCTTVKTPTPTPIIKLTNCGDLFCDSNKNEKCLIGGQFGNEPITYACVTPTPTPSPTPKIVAPVPTGPIKCGTEFDIYYCDQGFSCSGETDKACIENTPTPPILTKCTEFRHINTRVRKFKSNEVPFESINTCIRQFKGL